MRPTLVGNETETELSYRYQVINKGSGPAQFEKVEFLYRNEPVKPEFYKLKLKEELNNKDLRYRLSVTTPGQNSVMAPGDFLDLVFLEVNSEDKQKINNLEEGVFGITIRYRSSHGEKFTWSS